jgi:hypothetical protein
MRCWCCSEHRLLGWQLAPDISKNLSNYPETCVNRTNHHLQFNRDLHKVWFKFDSIQSELMQLLSQSHIWILNGTWQSTQVHWSVRSTRLSVMDIAGPRSLFYLTNAIVCHKRRFSFRLRIRCVLNRRSEGFRWTKKKTCCSSDEWRKHMDGHTEGEKIPALLGQMYDRGFLL